MEFKLLKFIQHPDFYNRLQNGSTHPHLSSFPSSSFTNPGLAPVRLYSFYTPLYSQPDVFTIKKKSLLEENDQVGGGDSLELNNEEESSNEGPTTNNTDLLQQLKTSKLLSNSEDPENFNEKKRKMIANNNIHNSFLHPKFVKTNSISVNDGSKNINKRAKITIVV